MFHAGHISEGASAFHNQGSSREAQPHVDVKLTGVPLGTAIVRREVALLLKRYDLAV